MTTVKATEVYDNTESVTDRTDPPAGSVEHTNESTADEALAAQDTAEESSAHDVEIDHPDGSDNGRAERALDEQALEQLAAVRRKALLAQVETMQEQQARLEKDFARFVARSEEMLLRRAQRARAQLLEASLNVADDLERWLQAAPHHNNVALDASSLEALVQGASMVCDSLSAFVESHVSTEIPAIEPATPPESAHAAEDPKEEPLTPEKMLESARQKLHKTAASYRSYRARLKVLGTQGEMRARAEVVQAFWKVSDTFSEAVSALRSDMDNRDASDTFPALNNIMDQTFAAYAQVLERFEVTRMDVMGQPFSVDHHEALSQAPQPGQATGTVLHEVRPGYLIGEQVLRYAQVIVAA